MLKLDHLAVSCERLNEGAEWLADMFGAPFQAGGHHALFGTHNMLMGLEDGLYLEVIAIDPSAPKPERARWFDLDNFAGLPRLTNWICRTHNITEALTKLPKAGDSVAIERGDLRWKMAVPPTGKLPFDNIHPALIEWEGDLHPAAMLTSQPVRLHQLRVFHPDAAEIEQSVLPLLTDARVIYVRRAEPGLEAEFETPNGKCVLK